MKGIFLKKATMDDVPQIFSLVNGYAEEHLMLPRGMGALYESIRDFVIAWNDEEVAGVGALHVLWKDLAEIRSLAVRKECCRKGIGRAIVDFLKEDAKCLGISEIFTLTYQPEFFSQCGFYVVTKDVFPHKVWTDCINCVKFPNCDEIAMKISL